MQILQKPNDLDLNLKYAQQQGKMGNYKQTISTLERLTILYPDNIEIKLYILSVLDCFFELHEKSCLPEVDLYLQTCLGLV